MTEHPPIPGEAWQAVADHYANWHLGFNNIERDALRVAAQVLWREWARGKAVVALPAPTGGAESPLWIVDAHTTVEAEPAVRCGEVSVWLNNKPFEPDGARKLAAALLAAADRADHSNIKDTGEVSE